jgi:hypothetical protein
MAFTADLRDYSYKIIRSKSREKLKLDCSQSVVAKSVVGDYKLVGGHIEQSPGYFIENVSCLF